LLVPGFEETRHSETYRPAVLHVSQVALHARGPCLCAQLAHARRHVSRQTFLRLTFMCLSVRTSCSRIAGVCLESEIICSSVRSRAAILSAAICRSSASESCFAQRSPRTRTPTRTRTRTRTHTHARTHAHARTRPHARARTHAHARSHTHRHVRTSALERISGTAGETSQKPGHLTAEPGACRSDLHRCALQHLLHCAVVVSCRGRWDVPGRTPHRGAANPYHPAPGWHHPAHRGRCRRAVRMLQHRPMAGREPPGQDGPRRTEWRPRCEVRGDGTRAVRGARRWRPEASQQ